MSATVVFFLSAGQAFALLKAHRNGDRMVIGRRIIHPATQGSLQKKGLIAQCDVDDVWLTLTPLGEASALVAAELAKASPMLAERRPGRSPRGFGDLICE